MTAKPAEYREWRVRNGKTVNMAFVRSCLRYRQEVRDLQREGFRECRSWATLPFQCDMPNPCRIIEARIANNGKALWVKVASCDTHAKR
jgi:hypothetical protein